MKEVKLENDTREMESAMATLLNYAACQVVIDKELHTPAVYDPQRMEVAINPDYPDGEMFAAIATAVAHSRLHGKGGITRSMNMPSVIWTRRACRTCCAAGLE